MSEGSVAVARTASLTQMQRWYAFRQGVLFVLGFAVFIMGAFGVAGTVLGDVFYEAREAVRVVGGVALIGLGLFTLGVLNIPFLYREMRADLSALHRVAGAAGAFLTGLGFAAGWTPCIGPFLGAILSMSVTTELSTRMVMLLAYVLGLGVPFLMVAALTDRAIPFLRHVQRHTRLIEVISGVLLIGVGVALLVGQISQLSAALAAVPFELEAQVLGEEAVLSIPVAAIAGLLSFLSPCVLPLVPAYLGFIGGVAVQGSTVRRA
ncbi:MAG: cytochrome c biogenesis protein CcdA [Anaerolineae bacterium]|nr:cytochrome c biogenesis protein CcdA [Anaerolineae bacterium]MDW8291787.1 cytochrome c biogenesis protein CcdA [Anaerolineae bacterium]